MGRVALGLSHVLSPVLLVSLLLICTPLRHNETSWVDAVVAAAFTVIIPWLFLLLSKFRGGVSDLHVTQRHQRHKIFALTAVSILCGLALLGWLGASSTMFIEVLSILAGLLTVALINLWWKVSVHLAVGCYVVLHISTSDAFLAPAILFIALLSWSRIRSNQHTASQVCGGVIVGVVISFVSSQLALLG
ncbi:hypothetical protein [Glutamicibacter arilaitensis]|uniref:hypothetical protein n=1 Tax=Glutamicibacter arilaitensis TaxID=256701 RepID=UPI00384CDA26